MQIVKLNIADIRRNPKNAKVHTAEQVRHIADSIERFGFNDPVGVVGEDNWLVEGDGRLQAMKLLGRTEIEAVRLDHLSEDDRRAYALVHNQTNLETGFDLPTLKLELGDLGLSGFGFSVDAGPDSQAPPQVSRFVKSFEEGKGKEDFFLSGGGDALPAPSAYPVAFTIGAEEYKKYLSVKEKRNINYKDVFLKGLGVL